MDDPASRHAFATQVRAHIAALLLVAAVTLLGLAVAPRWGSAAIDLCYLAAVMVVAIRAGLSPALFAAAGSTLCYAYFFTAPRLSWQIENPNDVATVVVLFGVALLTSQLAASARERARAAQADAARDATIAGFARTLLAARDEQSTADASVRDIAEVFGCSVVLLSGGARPELRASAPTGASLAPGDLAAAALVAATGSPAGRGVDRAVPSEWQFRPIRSGGAVIGVLGLAREDGMAPVPRDGGALLDNLLDQLALALERSRLEVEAQAFARSRERDRVRATLVASLGADLQPAVDAIGNAVDELRRAGGGERGAVSQIAAEAMRLDRYLGNLRELGSEEEDRPLRFGDVVIDLFRRTVVRAGEDVHLTPKEFAVLAELAKHPGRVLTHAHLLRTAWGPAQEAQVDYLRVVVRGLRQKLEQDPSSPTLILNEPAVGYRLRDD